MFKKKYKKYNKILNRLTWLNACLSGISVAIGISSVATFATFIRIPVSTVLGAASMTGAIAGGIILVLTKKYQQKLKNATRLIDIITPAFVVFKRVVSGALKNGVIDEEEFNMLQTLHLETPNELTGIDHRMEAEHRALVGKSLMEEINEIKKMQARAAQAQEQEFNCLLAVLFRVLLYKWIGYTINLLIFGKVRLLLRNWQNLAGRNLRQLNNGYLSKHSGKYIYQLLSELIDLITR